MYFKQEKEKQRKKRNKETIINHSYISSGKYRNKVRMISSDKKLNRMIYMLAKKMLEHRSGTEYEDMYWIDLDTCAIVAKETEQKVEHKVIYTKSTKKAIKKYEKLLVMHTHPHSNLPSVADFKSAYKNKYKVCLIICHNGRIYSYNCFENFSETLYRLKLMHYIQITKNEYLAEWETLKDLERSGKICIKEVTV